MHSDITNK